MILSCLFCHFLVLSVKYVFFSLISVIFAVVFLHFCSIFGENPTVKSLVHCLYLFCKKHSIAALLFTEEMCKVVPRYITDVITRPN